MIEATQFPCAERVRQYRASGYWADQSFHDVLFDAAKRYGGKEVFADSNRRLSYAELADEVTRCATFFRSVGIRSGDVVTLQLPNRVEFPVAFFALELIGAIANQISPDFRASELEYIMKFSQSVAYVCARNMRGFEYLPMARDVRTRSQDFTIICVDDVSDADVLSMANLARYESLASAQWVNVSPDRIIRMAFTSGTTGNPKAVLHSTNTTLYAAMILSKDMAVCESDVLLAYLPVGLNWGYLTLLQTIMTGARAYLMERFSSGEALGLIEREKVTYIPTAPASIMAMLGHDEIDSRKLDSLRVIITGGASAPVETIRMVQRRLPETALVELYGMLETGFHTYTRIGDDPLAVNGTVGRVVEGLELEIFRPDGTRADLFEEGEIAARGPSIHLGYLNNADENRKSFPGDDWFLTGDLGRFIDDAHNVAIVGRRKEIINRGGKKYFPREVEEILYEYPAFLQLAVVGVPDERVGEKAYLFAALRPGHEVTLEQVVALLRGKVADYKLPEQLVVVNEFPMTPTGKIKRADLVASVS
jgi:acyl-CoA synthetase (AMP-forming)/AMP-acid ligase II